MNTIVSKKNTISILKIPKELSYIKTYDIMYKYEK